MMVFALVVRWPSMNRAAVTHVRGCGSPDLPKKTKRTRLESCQKILHLRRSPTRTS